MTNAAGRTADRREPRRINPPTGDAAPVRTRAPCDSATTRGATGETAGSLPTVDTTTAGGRTAAVRVAPGPTLVGGTEANETARVTTAAARTTERRGVRRITSPGGDAAPGRARAPAGSATTRGATTQARWHGSLASVDTTTAGGRTAAVPADPGTTAGRTHASDTGRVTNAAGRTTDRRAPLRRTAGGAAGWPAGSSDGGCVDVPGTGRRRCRRTHDDTAPPTPAPSDLVGTTDGRGTATRASGAIASSAASREITTAGGRTIGDRAVPGTSSAGRTHASAIGRAPSSAGRTTDRRGRRRITNAPAPSSPPAGRAPPRRVDAGTPAWSTSPGSDGVPAIGAGRTTGDTAPDPSPAGSAPARRTTGGRRPDRRREGRSRGRTTDRRRTGPATDRRTTSGAADGRSTPAGADDDRATGCAPPASGACAASPSRT